MAHADTVDQCEVSLVLLAQDRAGTRPCKKSSGCWPRSCEAGTLGLACRARAAPGKGA